jgi:Mn-dependent DtxR family transcriptional regulator
MRKSTGTEGDRAQICEIGYLYWVCPCDNIEEYINSLLRVSLKTHGCFDGQHFPEDSVKHEPFDESVEMYLKTASELDVGNGPVPISRLADRLGVSAVSATEMVHRLCDQGYLDATPGAVVEALAEFLGQPATCPHGNLIPGPNGEMAEIVDLPLSDWRQGDSGVVSRLHPESLLLLDYAASQNIKPGQRVICEGRAPFHGPMMIKIGNDTIALGQEIAAHIFGVRDDS